MKHALFSYGTLQDPRIQKALFGHLFEFEPAYIENWGLYMADDGYLFVKPLEGSRVNGVVIELDSTELARADLWEDMTLYNRKMCTAFLRGDNTRPVFIYTRKKMEGTLFTGKKLHAHDIGDILKEIKRLA